MNPKFINLAIVIIMSLILYSGYKNINPSPSLQKGDCLAYHSTGDEFTPSKLLSYHLILDIGKEKYLTKEFSSNKSLISERSTEDIYYVERKLDKNFKKVGCKEFTQE